MDLAVLMGSRLAIHITCSTLRHYMPSVMGMDSRATEDMSPNKLALTIVEAMS